MAKQVTFDRGATSITIKAPAYPEQPGETYPMLVGRTMGGGVKTTDMGGGTDWENPVLGFRRLTTSEYENLRDFFQDTTSWTGLACTYTDAHAGVHTSMHYIGGLPEFRSEPGPSKGLWNGTLRLSKDMSA